MNFSQSAWDQIKVLKAGAFRTALKKDNWILVNTRSRGIHEHWQHEDGRIITLRARNRKTLGPRTVKSLLEVTGWSENRLKELKLIT